MPETYDLIVIGAGMAGVAAANKCASEGWRVAIVDELPYGGTCALRGCDPKKILRRGAEIIDSARLMRGKGIDDNGLCINWADLMKHKRGFTGPVPDNMERDLSGNGVETLHGTATFTGANQLEIDDHRYAAQHFLIATGARPQDLHFDGAEHLIDSTNFLDLDELPRRMWVVLADDHPVYRDGLARLLTDLGGFDVGGLAGDGAEAILLAGQHQPDVIVTDLRMPGIDGVEATRRVLADNPKIGIVVLTMFDDDELLHAAVRAGARGYLLKDADDTQIARVLTGIARGEAIFGPGTADRLLSTITRHATHQSTSPEFPQLTAREREILQHIARGNTNQQIAEILYLSERTVRNYVSNVFTKLDVDNRAQAITVARDAGLGQGSRHPSGVASTRTAD